MKKYLNYYAIIWAIALAVFNIIAYVAPDTGSKFTAGFWAGYALITLAFIGQLVCSFIFFKDDNKDKVFLNIPIFYISLTGLIVTGIVSGMSMIIPGAPAWIGAAVGILLLAFYAISVIEAKAAGEAVSDIGEKVKAQTFFIKALTVDAESVMARAQSDEAKDACKKVYEAIRYSDPMSNASLASAESQITLKFNEFASAVSANADNIGALANDMVILIGDRNKKCALLK